jgi:hypothetical protein
MFRRKMAIGVITDIRHMNNSRYTAEFPMMSFYIKYGERYPQICLAPKNWKKIGCLCLHRTIFTGYIDVDAFELRKNQAKSV